MKLFSNFLSVLITILLFSLWFFPAYLILKTGAVPWSALYLPIVVLTFSWGVVICNKYFNKNK